MYGAAALRHCSTASRHPRHPRPAPASIRAAINSTHTCVIVCAREERHGAARRNRRLRRFSVSVRLLIAGSISAGTMTLHTTEEQLGVGKHDQVRGPALEQRHVPRIDEVAESARNARRINRDVTHGSSGLFNYIRCHMLSDSIVTEAYGLEKSVDGAPAIEGNNECMPGVECILRQESAHTQYTESMTNESRFLKED